LPLGVHLIQFPVSQQWAIDMPFVGNNDPLCCQQVSEKAS